MTLTCTNVTLRQKALRNDRISHSIWITTLQSATPTR